MNTSSALLLSSVDTGIGLPPPGGQPSVAPPIASRVTTVALPLPIATTNPVHQDHPCDIKIDKGFIFTVAKDMTKSIFNTAWGFLTSPFSAVNAVNKTPQLVESFAATAQTFRSQVPKGVKILKRVTAQITKTLNTTTTSMNQKGDAAVTTLNTTLNTAVATLNKTLDTKLDGATTAVEVSMDRAAEKMDQTLDKNTRPIRNFFQYLSCGGAVALGVRLIDRAVKNRKIPLEHDPWRNYLSTLGAVITLVGSLSAGYLFVKNRSLFGSTHHEEPTQRRAPINTDPHLIEET